MLEIGDVAPEFYLQDQNAAMLSLPDILSESRFVLLIFLRHLGWMICAEHLVRVYEKQFELEALGVKVVMISFGTPAQARFWELETGVKFPMLFDPDQLVYKAYETERSFLRSWGLASIKEFVRLYRAGRRWRGVQGDSTQLGGDFLVDRAGLVRFAHYSDEPVDRPDINVLIDYIRDLPAIETAEE